jgi:glucosamine 6-phosphate synthetase-like amidotransferase/phosphosugar isomerase protein
MIGARNGSPLAIGYGHGEMYPGSDAIALAPFTVSYLDDGDWAVLTRNGVEFPDASGSKVKRAVLKTSASAPLPKSVSVSNDDDIISAAGVDHQPTSVVEPISQ